MKQRSDLLPTQAAQAASAGPGPSAHTITRQVLWFGAGQAVGQAAWYGTVVVLAALLSPRDFGTVALGMVIVRMATLMSNAGVGAGIIAAPQLSRGAIVRALRGNLAVALALSALVAAAAGPLTRRFASGGDPRVVLVLGAVIPLAVLSSVPEALLKKSLNFRTYAALTASAALLTALLAVGAGVAGAGAWALVVRQLSFQGFVAAFAWLATRKALRALPRGRDPAGAGGALRGRLAFMVLGVSVIGAMSLDNIVVGAVTDARQLGFYSLAFTLGFAPLTELSWRLGQIMFPAAAATPDLAAVGERTVRVVRGTAVLLLPLLPPAVVLAPRLVPALLGGRWQPMVAPLQVLLPVGVLHAIVNTIGESLSGTGNIRFRARRESVWAAGTLGAVGALTAIDGITGAALGHLLVFLPLAAVYSTAGARRIGTSGRRLWTALRDVLVPVAGQAAVTLGVAHALARAGATPAAVAAAGAGLGTCVLLMRLAPSRPLREAGVILRLVLPRRLLRGGGVAGRTQAAGSTG